MLKDLTLFVLVMQYGQGPHDSSFLLVQSRE